MRTELRGFWLWMTIRNTDSHSFAVLSAGEEFWQLSCRKILLLTEVFKCGDVYQWPPGCRPDWKHAAAHFTKAFIYVQGCLNNSAAWSGAMFQSKYNNRSALAYQTSANRANGKQDLTTVIPLQHAVCHCPGYANLPSYRTFSCWIETFNFPCCCRRLIAH